jgi:DNA helicase HerA-like ATPase
LEAKKYAIILDVMSQWPSELASTNLAQCTIAFAFRRSNERYQETTQAMIAEASPTFPVLPGESQPDRRGCASTFLCRER